MQEGPLSSAIAQENAARLRAVAHAVDDESRRLAVRVDGLHYEGPAARRFRAAMADRHHRAQRLAHRLQQVAHRVGQPNH
jgi:hypothetical protein